MLAVALALASSVVWGTADFLGGIYTRRLGLAPVLVVSQLAGLILLGVATGLTGELDVHAFAVGLAGDRIPMGARILLAVESYLAMAGERSFGGLLSEQDSLDRIKLGAGRIYDPAVVAALAAEVGPTGPASST